MSESFEILKSGICFEAPERVTDVVSWHGHIPFAFFCIELFQPHLFVELGTHKGDSYCAFCQAVRFLNLNCTCRAIDTWRGDVNAGFYGDEVFHELEAHHNPRYETFSALKRETFDEALNDFSDGSIDLLHIDGLHTYDAVSHDFYSWLPKMSPKGVVLLHDIHVRENDFGVWKLWEELKKKYPSFEFYHSHGLGVLGVGNSLRSQAKDFFFNSNKEKKFIRNLFSSLGNLFVCNECNHALERRVSANDREIEQRKSYQAELETKIEALQSELQKRDSYQRELETRVERSFQEIQDRNRYQRDLENRLEKMSEEIQRRGDYIGELEGRVEEHAMEVSRRGEYIAELNSIEAELRTKLTEVTQRLEAFQESWFCRKWISYLPPKEPKAPEIED